MRCEPVAWCPTGMHEQVAEALQGRHKRVHNIAECPPFPSAQQRDVDLDTLEKIVNIVAYGDIEAEDTRHLTELNFIKIFRLSQMMIEYLLYVQDCLQSSNNWMQQDR